LVLLFQVKTFNEGCVMVRPPALELISYLKKADYSNPPLRCILCILKQKIPSQLFYFVHISLPYFTHSLTMCFRWRYWLWKDNVFVSCPALLLHSGLADPAHTWWWAALTQSKCKMMWSLESDDVVMFSL